MNQSVHQLLQVILQGISWVLRTIETLWVWSWSQITHAFERSWWNLPPWKIVVGLIFIAILAYILYVSKPYLPQKIATSLGDFYDAVVNKYYVDEIYAKVFVKPLVDASTTILWQGVDRKVIDDTVNDAAEGARHVSDGARHMQSGNLRSYAGWIASGAAIVIAYMVWRGMGQ